jgi:hypothetical protein
MCREAHLTFQTRAVLALRTEQHFLPLFGQQRRYKPIWGLYSGSTVRQGFMQIYFLE